VRVAARLAGTRAFAAALHRRCLISVLEVRFRIGPALGVPARHGDFTRALGKVGQGSGEACGGAGPPWRLEVRRRRAFSRFRDGFWALLGQGVRVRHGKATGVPARGYGAAEQGAPRHGGSAALR